MNKQYKILIISSAFYPGISPRAFRATELTIELAKQGHSITVYTPTNGNDFSIFEKKNHCRIKNIGNMNLPSVVYKKNKILYNITRGINRLLDILFYYPYIELFWKIPGALVKENTFDLLISIAYPYSVHWGCARALKNKPNLAKVWIADCGDPFFSNGADSIGRPFYFKPLDSWFKRKATYITIPIEEAREAYGKKSQQKIHVIPQGYNFNNIKKEADKPDNQIPTFAYAGLVIPKYRDPSAFLDYLDKQNIDFHFHVFTQTEGLFSKFKEKWPQKISIHRYIPRDELITFLSAMDFLVNFENNTNRQSPSKLIDYALTGRPILSIASHDIQPASINAFLNGDYSGAYKIQDLEKYNIKNVAQQFISLFESTTV